MWTISVPCQGAAGQTLAATCVKNFRGVFSGTDIRHSTEVVEVCRFGGGEVPGIAVLHSPLEPGRVSLSIFALPNLSIEIAEGESAAPPMMARVELRLPAGTVGEPRPSQRQAALGEQR